ncbi:MAG: EcsC family protein [Roseiarcus sp.]|uniref:EcsC family protein n=1 Tax=Roseiarcus sp. TaxID=1969460 RepID=UPI003BAE84BE
MSTIEVMPAGLTRKETEDLRRAIVCLEGSSFAQRLTDAIGRPVAALSWGLPASARRVVAYASERALSGALKLALRTIDLRRSARPSANRAHKFAAAASGALGGAFGLAALPVELPLSTTILLRSIAEIAREEGEDLTAPQAAVACIEVFALGSRHDEETFESGYFAVRAALAKSVTDSARFVASQGAGAQSAPLVARFISQIAARFGVVVSEKLAAQSAPVIGAIGGAAVNAAFAEHFQTLARGHFIVRRLEREHGAGLVAFEYQRLRGEAARA